MARQAPILVAPLVAASAAILAGARPSPRAEADVHEYAARGWDDAHVDPHFAVSWVAAVTVGAATLGALAAAFGAASKRALDRLVLVAVVVLVAAALAGVARLFTSAPPRDPLHLLYGVVAPLAILAGRFLGSPAWPRRALYVAAGSAVALGVVVRSFMTGA